MLKVTDNGVLITLTGKSAISANTLYKSFFIILAVAVVLAVSAFNIMYAFFCLLFFVSYHFLSPIVIKRMNARQQNTLSNQLISSGQLEITNGLLTHQDMGKQQRIPITHTHNCSQQDTTLIIYDDNKDVKATITGFESAREVEIAVKVLQGQKMGKRNANISMTSN